MLLKVLNACLFIVLKGAWTFLTAKGIAYVLVLSELEGKLLKVQNVLLLEQSSQRDCTFSKREKGNFLFHSSTECSHELPAQFLVVAVVFS